MPSDDSSATTVNSSVGLVVRAIVMIGCLIAIPLAAMFGRGANGEAPRTESTASVEDRATPPVAEPSQPSEGQLDAAAGSQSPAASFDPPRERLQRLPPVGGEARLSAPPSASLWSPPPADPVERSVKTVEFRETVLATDGAGRRSLPRAAPANSNTSPTVDGRDSAFSTIQKRLRELGVDYCRLESCGAAGEEFRFVCRVRSAEPNGESRVFQVIDADPHRAMHDAAEQVEAWRAADAASDTASNPQSGVR